MKPMDRVELGRMQNPVRGFLHGSAAVVSIVGLVALLVRSDGTQMIVVSAIYGMTLTAMYLTSALYHSVPWRQTWKARFQKLDHTFIYALVAATFTPLVVGAADSVWVVAIGLTGVWGLVALGLTRELVTGPASKTILPLQFLAVGVTLAPLWVTLATMDTITAALTVGGGVIYLVGVFLFVKGWPRLAPRIFSHHEVWHIVVIVASIVHFAAVWRVISLG